MVRTIPAFLCFCALQIVLTGILGAQNAAGGLKFSCASWERVEGSPIFYFEGVPKENESKEAKLKRLKEVDVPEMTRSLLYEFKAGRKIEFFRKKSGDEGEVILVPVASTTVPAGWSRALLVFFPAKKKGTYGIFALQDDRVHAPYGSYQFVNLTNHKIAGFLDDQKIALKGKGRSIIKLRGDETRPLNFGVWTIVDEKKKWLQRNTLSYRPNKYLVYFFFAEEDGLARLKVKSKGIVDFRPPPVVDGKEADDGETP